MDLPRAAEAAAHHPAEIMFRATTALRSESLPSGQHVYRLVGDTLFAPDGNEVAKASLKYARCATVDAFGRTVQSRLENAVEGAALLEESSTLGLGRGEFSFELTLQNRDGLTALGYNAATRTLRLPNGQEIQGVTIAVGLRTGEGINVSESAQKTALFDHPAHPQTGCYRESRGFTITGISQEDALTADGDIAAMIKTGAVSGRTVTVGGEVFSVAGWDASAHTLTLTDGSGRVARIRAGEDWPILERRLHMFNGSTSEGAANASAVWVRSGPLALPSQMPIAAPEPLAAVPREILAHPERSPQPRSERDPVEGKVLPHRGSPMPIDPVVLPAKGEPELLPAPRAVERQSSTAPSPVEPPASTANPKVSEPQGSPPEPAVPRRVTPPPVVAPKATPPNLSPPKLAEKSAPTAVPTEREVPTLNDEVSRCAEISLALEKELRTFFADPARRHGASIKYGCHYSSGNSTIAIPTWTLRHDSDGAWTKDPRMSIAVRDGKDGQPHIMWTIGEEKPYRFSPVGGYPDQPETKMRWVERKAGWGKQNKILDELAELELRVREHALKSQ